MWSYEVLELKWRRQTDKSQPQGWLKWVHWREREWGSNGWERSKGPEWGARQRCFTNIDPLRGGHQLGIKPTRYLLVETPVQDKGRSYTSKQISMLVRHPWKKKKGRRKEIWVERTSGGRTAGWKRLRRSPEHRCVRQSFTGPWKLHSHHRLAAQVHTAEAAALVQTQWRILRCSNWRQSITRTLTVLLLMMGLSSISL